jgi:hypothetical protein
LSLSDWDHGYRRAERRARARILFTHNSLGQPVEYPIAALVRNGKLKVARLPFFRWHTGMSPMDEAHSLRFLWWTVGGMVGAVFLLNAIALSLI